jgi:TonB family protein
VLAHELVHVRQGHSFDMLWLEGWRALLWFNPFAHLLLPALRLTHELLADWEAMLHVASPADALAPAPPYPSLLARLAVRRVVYSSLLQSFAFSFTLTRIAMLQNQIPVRRWKQWLALPILGGVFLATACQTHNEEVAPKATPAQAADGASAEAMKANIVRMLREKLAPLEQQRRAGQPLSEAQQRAYDYVQQQIKNAQEIAPATPAPPIPYEPYEKGKAPTPITNSGKVVYTYVEQMPALPSGGGMMAIVQQIQQNLVYPGGPRQEGRVFAGFIVLADGSVSETKILKSLGPAYDDAVVAAIQKLPRFVPGTQNGQPVAVSFTVPITFKNQL